MESVWDPWMTDPNAPVVYFRDVSVPNPCVRGVGGGGIIATAIVRRIEAADAAELLGGRH